MSGIGFGCCLGTSLSVAASPSGEDASPSAVISAGLAALLCCAGSLAAVCGSSAGSAGGVSCAAASVGGTCLASPRDSPACSCSAGTGSGVFAACSDAGSSVFAADSSASAVGCFAGAEDCSEVCSNGAEGWSDCAEGWSDCAKGSSTESAISVLSLVLVDVIHYTAKRNWVSPFSRRLLLAPGGMNDVIDETGFYQNFFLKAFSVAIWVGSCRSWVSPSALSRECPGNQSCIAGIMTQQRKHTKESHSEKHIHYVRAV